MRYILYSPKFGAGWSSWNTEIPKKFICEYEPIIKALQNNENLLGSNKDHYNADISLYHPAIQQFVSECKEKYQTTPYLGGLEDLTIYAVEDGVQVRIEEYDGYERVVEGYTDFF